MKNANPVSTLLHALLISTAMLAFTGCDRGAPAGAVAAEAAKTVTDRFPIQVGGQMVRMQLAVRMPEMQHGLMDRRDLQPDEGMLFVYDKPQPMSFWMRNTPTALDIGFFTADGVLREVYPLYPFDETPVKSRSENLQFALEMNQGWFSAQGVRPGAKLDLKAFTTALKARGFEPKAYGLE